MYKMLIPVIFCWFLSSCTITDKQPQSVPVAMNAYLPYQNLIAEAVLTVKDGDLVLRNGQEFSSQFIKRFNRHDKSYSHAGLIFYKGGYPYVYDIVPGDENPDTKLRCDSLKNFCNPRKNFGFALYRYNLDSTEIKKLHSVVEQWKKEGVAFDSTFDLKSNDRMYCSEMIKKGLAIATQNRIVISTEKLTKKEAQFFAAYLHLPVSYTAASNVVAVDDLYINPFCRLIRKFDFTSQK